MILRLEPNNILLISKLGRQQFEPALKPPHQTLVYSLAQLNYGLSYYDATFFCDGHIRLNLR